MSILLNVGAGPQSFTLTADAGSYILSGQVVVFAISASINVGAYTYSGQIAVFGVSGSVAVGSYTDTGQIANMALSIVHSVGSYIFTGVDSTLTFKDNQPHYTYICNTTVHRRRTYRYRI